MRARFATLCWWSELAYPGAAPGDDMTHSVVIASTAPWRELVDLDGVR
jgi:hypothetical protein